MQYNTMYDVYRELSARFPEAYLDYNSSYDSISYVTENYEITALSNYNQPFLSIRNTSEQYQYNLENLNDASGFISELLSGNIKFSYDQFSAVKRLKIDGWTNTRRKKKENTKGTFVMTAGVLLMILSAFISIFNVGLFITGGGNFFDELCPMPLWLGIFITGLFMVINCNKVRFLDIAGFCAGTSFTAFPIAVIMSMIGSGDLSIPAGVGISAFFWAIGAIVRKNCKKRIEESDDIYLDQLPGPVYENQSNEWN